MRIKPQFTLWYFNYLWWKAKYYIFIVPFWRYRNALKLRLVLFLGLDNANNYPLSDTEVYLQRRKNQEWDRKDPENKYHNLEWVRRSNIVP